MTPALTPQSDVGQVTSADAAMAASQLTPPRLVREVKRGQGYQVAEQWQTGKAVRHESADDLHKRFICAQSQRPSLLSWAMGHILGREISSCR